MKIHCVFFFLEQIPTIDIRQPQLFFKTINLIEIQVLLSYSCIWWEDNDFGLWRYCCRFWFLLCILSIKLLPCSLNGSSNAVNQHFNRSFDEQFRDYIYLFPFCVGKYNNYFVIIFPATNDEVLKYMMNHRSLTRWSWIRLVCIVPCLNYQCECTLQINERHYYFVFWNWKSWKVKINL